MPVASPRHAKDRRVKDDIGKMAALDTVEKNIVAGQFGPDGQDTLGRAADIDRQRAGQRDHLRLVKGIEVVIIEVILTHGKRLACIQHDETALPRLLQDRPVKNSPRHRHGTGKKQGHQKRGAHLVQHHRRDMDKRHRQIEKSQPIRHQRQMHIAQNPKPDDK